MVAGRPKIYNKYILEKTQEYITSCQDVDEDIKNGIKRKVKIPTIEGLAYFIKVNRDTIYEWCKENEKFSDIIDDLRAIQADRLLNNGLAGTYNSTIAKVLLTKHGYREGIDTTTNDKDLNISNDIKNKIDDSISKYLNEGK